MNGPPEPVFEPTYSINLPHVYSGKVRDIYSLGEDHFIMITSDRISAFDVVMAQTVPNKGRVLTAMSAFWFDQLRATVPGHLVSTEMVDMPEAVQAHSTSLAGRTMLTKRAEMVPIECIVRGYITGSAWKEYKASGTMHGEVLPRGLQEADRLPEPVFTPSTKADSGHDINIGFDDAVNLVGSELARELRDVSMRVYNEGAALAAERGIIIADTKFEFGLVDGQLTLCDEVLTPDSSRFWSVDSWKPGATPPSFDKQPVRDYLESLEWDKTYPPPTLDPAVLSASALRYVTAYERITGLSFADWPGVSNAGDDTND